MIAIRYKPLASGKFSIYLDCYNRETKKRSYRFLNLQVTRDYSKTDKIAPSDLGIMQTLQKTIEHEDFDSFKDKKKTGDDFNEAHPGLMFFLKTEYGYKEQIRYLLNHINRFLNNRDIPLTDLNQEWINRFMEYLTGQISTLTATAWLLNFRSCLEKAKSKGIIDKNPFTDIPLDRVYKEERPYLETEELNMLIDTPVNFNHIRDAFLFSVYSGIGWNDIKKLTWKGVLTVSDDNKEHVFVELKQLQTQKSYRIKLEEQALQIIKMYARKENGLVFDRLPSLTVCNNKLHLWEAMAGIGKNVCFSMARHTFAMHRLQKGESLREVSDKLGISDIFDVRVYKNMLEKEKK